MSCHSNFVIHWLKKKEKDEFAYHTQVRIKNYLISYAGIAI